MTHDLLEKTLNAIDVLNNQKDGDFQEAHKFLIEIHNSNIAWTIADQLLQSYRSQYSAYFGAETMKSKIQKNFEELPVESHMSLKQSLMDHLQKDNISSDHIISNQLCIALADLYCHMIKWESGIDEIISTFTVKIEYIPVLLDILKYIPEEYSNKSLRLGINRKNQLFSDMENRRLSIIAIIDQSVELKNEVVMLKAIQCFDSWYGSDVFRDSDLINSKIVPYIYQLLQNPIELSEQLFKASAQCASNFFRLDIQVIPEMMSLFMRYTFELDSAYVICEQSKPEYCLEYTKIFCEMAYSLLPYVISNPIFDERIEPSNVKTLNLIILSSRTNVECCSQVLYTLSSLLEDQNYSCTVDSQTKLGPIFEKLIAEIVKFYVVTQHDDDDSLCKFRQEVFVVMEALPLFLHVESLFSQLLSYLAQLLEKNCMNEAEAVLYVISSMIKFVNKQSNNEINQWIEQLLNQIILPSVGSARASFQYVAFTMFGELSTWAYDKLEITSQMMEEIARFIEIKSQIAEDNYDKVTITAINSALSSAGCFIRRHSTYMMMNGNWDRIMRICNSLPQIKVVPKEMVYMFENLGRCVFLAHKKCTVLEMKNPELFYKRLSQLFGVNLMKLNQIVATNGSGGNTNSIARTPNDPCVWLDNISAVYSVMSGMTNSVSNSTEKLPYLNSHVMVFEHLVWPTISQLLEVYINEGRVLERVVRVLRYGIRSLQCKTKPIIVQLAEKIVNCYSTSKESCFLYLGGILVDEFSADESVVDGLMQMYFALCQPTSQVLQDHGLEENSNTAEDFFRLTLRLVQHWSSRFFSSNLDIARILELGVRGVSCSNFDTCELAMRMLTEIFAATLKEHTNSNFRIKINQWLSDNGLGLTLYCLVTLCKSRPEELIGENNGVLDDGGMLLEQLRKLSEGMSGYFEKVFDSVLSSSGLTRKDGLAYVTPTQLEQFRNSILTGNSLAEPLEAFAKLFM